MGMRSRDENEDVNENGEGGRDGMRDQKCLPDARGSTASLLQNISRDDKCCGWSVALRVSCTVS